MDSTPAIPEPGDLVLVEKSYWYAIGDGQQLRVCEPPGWSHPRREIHVAPRHCVRTFWGPQWGAPDGRRPEIMSTSGGPFTLVSLPLLEELQVIKPIMDSFWRWRDWPCRGGGVEYCRKVTLWRLPTLPHPCWLEPD